MQLKEVYGIKYGRELDKTFVLQCGTVIEEKIVEALNNERPRKWGTIGLSSDDLAT